MEKQNIFQIVVIGVFAVLILLGFLAFSGRLPLPTGDEDVNYGTVTVWGTLPKAAMNQLIGDLLAQDTHVRVTYTEKKKETFENDFVEALARGNGPDLILVSQDNIPTALDKLALVPYTTMSQGEFKNSFLQESSMFLRDQGIVALPITIDPIVMYWNRDIFSNALVPQPPTSWSQFYDLVPRITTKDATGNITQSLVALGEYNNISHAKEIISFLMMQAGSPIVTFQNGSPTAALFGANVSGENPVMAAIRFYTEFSKPGKDAYSWNRSLPQSRTMFESGNLALYFGYASEYKDIAAKNPHLNFDVMMVPQTGSGSSGSTNTSRLTYGQMQGVALVRMSKNQQGALYVARMLSSKEAVGALSKILGLPPARLDLISAMPDDATQTVFYNSALISRGWYDPSPTGSSMVFSNMIDDITSGRSLISQALSDANSSLGKLLVPSSRK